MIPPNQSKRQLAGGSSANVILTRDLYQAALPEIASISSNESGDSPVGTLYTESTKELTVSGLTPSKIRTLTINYLAETENEVMRVIGPFMIIILFLIVLGAIIYSMVHKGKRG